MAADRAAFCLGLTLASPVALHAGERRRSRPPHPRSLRKTKPQSDLSKLVWPEPPNIPRVRYTSYFAGMKLD